MESFFFYAFLHFSLITRVFQKIENDEAQGIIVVPDWPNQPWFPLFHAMLKSEPLFLTDDNILIFPIRQKKTIEGTRMIAGIVCARHIK